MNSTFLTCRSFGDTYSFLKGKAKVVFHDDWSMTPEELEML